VLPAAPQTGIALDSGRVLSLFTHAVLVLTAMFFVAIGFVTLTEPMAVPFTVSMWLCAAAFAGLVAFWRPVT
jgi:hypothetical protein